MSDSQTLQRAVPPRSLLLELPVEIIMAISDFLDPPSMARLARTCKALGRGFLLEHLYRRDITELRFTSLIYGCRHGVMSLIDRGVQNGAMLGIVCYFQNVGDKQLQRRMLDLTVSVKQYDFAVDLVRKYGKELHLNVWAICYKSLHPARQANQFKSYWCSLSAVLSTFNQSQGGLHPWLVEDTRSVREYREDPRVTLLEEILKHTKPSICKASHMYHPILPALAAGHGFPFSL